MEEFLSLMGYSYLNLLLLVMGRAQVFLGSVPSPTLYLLRRGLHIVCWLGAASSNLLCLLFQGKLSSLKATVMLT